MVSANIDAVEIATQVVEAAGALGSVYTSYKILRIARNYYNLYKEQRDFYYSTFQYGVEAPLAAEVFAMPRPQLDYTKQAQTIYDASTGVLGGSAGDAYGWWERHAAMYYDKPDEGITELEPDLARLRSDWANYLFRFEEHDVDVRQDIRLQRRLTIHNIGLKQGAYISSALSTAFGVFEDALSGTGDMFATLANGAGMYAAYRRGQTDTYSDFAQYGYKHHSRDVNARDDSPREYNNRVVVDRGERPA